MYCLLFQRNQPKFESNKILFSWFSGKETESFSVNAIGLVVCILWFRKSGELNKNYTNIGSKIPKQQRQKLVYHFQFAMGSIDMCAFILTLFRHDIIWYVSYCKVFETRSATPMTEFIWSKLLYKSSGAVCSFAVFFCWKWKSATWLMWLTSFAISAFQLECMQLKGKDCTFSWGISGHLGLALVILD